MPERELRALVDYLRSEGYLLSPRIRDAMLRIDRIFFVPESERSVAYADVALPVGYGQTISAPTVVAFMLEALDVRRGMSVLEVGTGSGYNCALLSKLAGPSGKVTSIDIVPELVDRAKANVASAGVDSRNIDFVSGDGSAGYEQNAPYDRIIVTAAMPSFGLSHPLARQLKPEGKLVAPVGSMMYQDLILYNRKTGESKSILPVMFVPLIGKFGFRKD